MKCVLDFYIIEKVLLAFILGKIHNKGELFLIQWHLKINSSETYTTLYVNK